MTSIYYDNLFDCSFINLRLFLVELYAFAIELIISTGVFWGVGCCPGNPSMREAQARNLRLRSESREQLSQDYYLYLLENISIPEFLKAHHQTYSLKSTRACQLGHQEFAVSSVLGLPVKIPPHQKYYIFVCDN